ncbi:hypothetical protein [Mycobacterium sp. MAA66]|uniref:hypothetical protein n=1 Tax=Mycobacterium sp. MAA66 TaxID=3156297 RepID=UPI0035157D46
MMTAYRTLAMGLLAGAGALTMVAAIPEPTSAADVCGSIGGRRISVSGCGDPIERWAPPPAAYAPLPEDFSAVPPPPPAPNVNVCANVGRRINISGCI